MLRGAPSRASFPYSDQDIYWIHRTSEKVLTFENDAEFVGRLTE